MRGFLNGGTNPPQQLPQITSPTTLDYTEGEVVSEQIIASNDPTSFTVLTGSLPSGLSLSLSGLLSGTLATGLPTQVTCTIRVSNGAGNTDVLFTFNIAEPALLPVLVSPLVINAVIGYNFWEQMVFENNPTSVVLQTPYTGVSIESNSILRGLMSLPNTAESIPLTIRATNANGFSDTVVTLNRTVNNNTTPPTKPSILAVTNQMANGPAGVRVTLSINSGSAPNGIIRLIQLYHDGAPNVIIGRVETLSEIDYAFGLNATSVTLFANLPYNSLQNIRMRTINGLNIASPESDVFSFTTIAS